MLYRNLQEIDKATSMIQIKINIDPFPAMQDFSLLHSVQTDSGAQLISYPVVNGGSFFFAEVKWPGREADHPLPSNAEIEKVEA
jgi:hypothetical protein